MVKIVILFASLTGNTESIAQTIANTLIDNHVQVDIKSFNDDEIDMDAISNYDAILVGTYTWDDGELPYEIEDFYDDLEEIDLTGKTFGVFGSADSYYECFGGAIDLMGDRAADLGATILPKRLKIDIMPQEDDIQRCEEFALMTLATLYE